MATIFDIDFSGAPDGALNAAVPSGFKWSEAATNGFVFSAPAISEGAVVSTLPNSAASLLDKVALNRLLPGNDYGDVFDSWYVNGEYSAVPGRLTMQFTLNINSDFSQLEFGCRDIAAGKDRPTFFFGVDAAGRKYVSCRVGTASSDPGVDLSSAGLLVGGALNTAVISWDEYSVSFALNGTSLYTRSSSARPYMHPFLFLRGAARITRFSAGDLQPEPTLDTFYWTNLKNAVELP